MIFLKIPSVTNVPHTINIAHIVDIVLLMQVAEIKLQDSSSLKTSIPYNKILAKLHEACKAGPGVYDVV